MANHNGVYYSNSSGLNLRTNTTTRINISTGGVIQFNSAYTFPTSDGSTDEVLLTNGSGALSFGTVPNAGLTNSSLTLGSTSVSLGGTASSIAGLTSITADTVYANSVLRISQNGDGLRMTNVGAFDNDGSNNFRIFSTNDLILSTNGESGTAVTFDSSSKDATFQGQVIGSFSGSGANLNSIPNSSLDNSSITIGSTAVSLGNTITALNDLTSVTIDSTNAILTLDRSATSNDAAIHFETNGSSNWKVGTGLVGSDDSFTIRLDNGGSANYFRLSSAGLLELSSKVTMSDGLSANTISATTIDTSGDISVGTLGSTNDILIVGTGKTITSTDVLSINPTSKYVGINQSSPEVTLHMTGEGAQSAQIRMEQYNDSSDAPDIRTRKSRGTADSPSKNNAGDFIYRQNAERYDGSSFVTVGQLAVDANSSNADRFQLTLTVSEDGGSVDAADNQFKIDGNDSGAITFNNAYKFPTSDGSNGQVLTTDGSGTLSFTDTSSGTVTSVAISGSDGIDVDSGSPITSSGTIALGLSNVPNSSLANSSLTVTAGNGLANGGSVSLGGSTTLNVGAGTGIVVNANDVALDYVGTNNFIDSATNLEGTSIATSDTIIYHDATDNNVKKGLVSDLPFSNTSGTVTSVAISGSDGIDVDSGSPITTNGTIALGLSNVPNSSLSNSSFTVNAPSGSDPVVPLGGTLNFTSSDSSVTIAGNSGTDTIDLTVGNAVNTYVTGGTFTSGSLSLGLNDGSSAQDITGFWSNIPNSALSNDSVTIGTTSIDLGASSTTLAGLTSVTSTAFSGNLTGNVTGDLTGDVTGDVTGNADTATALETARNFSITGDVTASNVSFDGTGNVSLNGTVTKIQGVSMTSAEVTQLANIGTTTISAAQWGYLGGQDQSVATGDDVSFNSIAGPLTGDVQGNLDGNAGTATTLEAPRNFSITGDITASAISFDGSTDVQLNASIDAGVVNTAELATNAVTTVKITDANVTNAKLANSSLTVTAGNGLTDGGSVSLGGSTTLNVGAGTGVTVAANSVGLDYSGTNNFIDSATDLEGTDIALTDTIIYHDATDNNVKKGLISDLPYTNSSGTVTSVAISGSDGIDVDSGSPITTSGTIALGLSNVPNSSLANSSVTVTGGNGLTGGGEVSLGSSITLNVGAGTLIDVDGSNVNVDLSESTTSTSNGDGDFFVVVDSSNNQKKLTKANINNSGFNNDAGYITSAGNTNIYGSDGTLSAARTVTQNGNNLEFKTTGGANTKFRKTTQANRSLTRVMIEADDSYDNVLELDSSDPNTFLVSGYDAGGARVFTVDGQGNLMATSKAFDIPHPNPEKKEQGMRLKHGNLEGPEHGIYIRGRQLNDKEIELPEYWKDLVDPDSITVQLTSVGSHQNLYVKEIKDWVVYIQNGNLFSNKIDCYYFIQAERIDVDKIEVEYTQQ